MSPSPGPLAPPAAPRTEAHADTAHGVVIIRDEYRWMERAGMELDPWIDAEDAYARATLAALPGRAALRERIAELWRTGVGDVDETVLDERAGRTLVLDYSLDRPRLGVYDGDGAARIVYDPAADGPEEGGAVRPAATLLSPDGRYASVGLVERGEANPRLRILDLTTGAWLPEVLSPPLWADARAGGGGARGRCGPAHPACAHRTAAGTGAPCRHRGACSSKGRRAGARDAAPCT